MNTNGFLEIYPVKQTGNSQNTPYNAFNAINIPYGSCLLPSNPSNRQGAPGPDVFGDGVSYVQCMPKVVQPNDVLGVQNNTASRTMDAFFFQGPQNPQGSSKETFSSSIGGPTDLQSERPREPYDNYYIQLAASTLHVKPDMLLGVFFSDSNLIHIRNVMVQKIREITKDSGVTPEGVNIKPPNMDDLFYYMINIYQNYKVYNGSICFVNLQNKETIKSEITKLNSDVLQEYVSKLVSQINMYIYYYKDASQLPEQLSMPTYTSMKGSRTLEYNNGFVSGNSMGASSYNEVGNIF